jgi:hypothetical protein
MPHHPFPPDLNINIRTTPPAMIRTGVLNKPEAVSATDETVCPNVPATDETVCPRLLET